MKFLSPGVALAALFVLIATQAFRLMRPAALPYVVNLLLAMAGLLGGEVIALVPRFAGPAVGILHPIPDAIGIALMEFAGTFVLSAWAPKVRATPNKR